MSFLNFAEKIGLIIEDLNQNRERESLIIAKETLALVRLRIQNYGEDSEGQAFDLYSQAVLPKWFYKGKSLNKTSEDRVDNGAWMLSYEEFREINNLRTDIKDFTFTGDMWRNVGVVSVEVSGASVSVAVGGQTTRAADLISYHSDKYGNLLAPNESEIDFLTAAHKERVFNTINKYLAA